MRDSLLLVSACASLFGMAACGDTVERADPDGGAPVLDGSMPPPDGSPPTPDSGPDAERDARPDPDADIPPIGIAHSFDVVARFEPDGVPPGPGGELPAEHAFTLRLESAPGGLYAIAGAAGTTGEVMLESRGDGSFGFGTREYEGLQIGLARDLGACGGPGPVGYESMELRLERTADATVGRVVGTARGRVQMFGGDVIWDVPFRATFEGTLDRTPPSFRTNAAPAHHVLDAITVALSEPVAAGQRVSLRGVGALDSADGDGGARRASARFTTPYPTILPWGTTLSFVFEPALVDLAGNAGGTDDPLEARTIDDPGLLAQDGFESGAQAYRRGDVVLVAPGTPAPAAITGGGALFVGPGDFGGSGAGGGRFTARLAVAPGARWLRARYRLLSMFGSGGFYARFVLVAPNAGTTSEVYPAGDPSGRTEPSGLERLPDATPVLELEAPLPDGAAGEVILDIDLRIPACGGLLPPPTGILLDDLRTE